MLVLKRYPEEEIVIGTPGQQITLVEPIRILVVEQTGKGVRLGVEAQNDLPVHRKEVYERIKEEKSNS